MKQDILQFLESYLKSLVTAGMYAFSAPAVRALCDGSQTLSPYIEENRRSISRQLPSEYKLVSRGKSHEVDKH